MDIRDPMSRLWDIKLAVIVRDSGRRIIIIIIFYNSNSNDMWMTDEKFSPNSYIYAIKMFFEHKLAHNLFIVCLYAYYSTYW